MLRNRFFKFIEFARHNLSLKGARIFDRILHVLSRVSTKVVDDEEEYFLKSFSLHFCSLHLACEYPLFNKL